MNGQVIGVLSRAVLYSFLAAVAAAIIYVIILLATGGKWNSGALTGSLSTGGISFVIALIFFSVFTLIFSRKKA